MTAAGDKARPSWLPALTAIRLVQTTCAFLTRLIPTLAPLIDRDLGVSDAAIGYFGALNIAGSIAFLVIGTPFIRRYGPLRDAGVLFAIMQATGVFGRVLLGGVADRLGSGRRT